MPGIPVTHRDINSAVTFVTGHSSDGAVPDGLDWGAIARGSPVIVLYMASKHLPSIAARLLSRRPPARRAGRGRQPSHHPEQSVLVSTLGEIAGLTAAIRPPAIVVVGEVVRLREALDWSSSHRTPMLSTP